MHWIYRFFECWITILLINWLTNELKLKIKSTNKLIHFTPTVITKLYQFYAKIQDLRFSLKLSFKQF